MLLKNQIGIFLGAVISILLLLFLIKFFNLSYPISVVTATRSGELSVIGEGKVEAVPDIATVTAGITVSAAGSVAEAQQKISQINNTLIDSMKNLGIETKDIQSSNYSIIPNQTFANGSNAINGYNGNASVVITVREISKVSQVIDAATKAGANEIQGTNFSIQDPEKYREQARTQAIDNAKAQAQQLAQSLGIHLGKITNIAESNQGVPRPIVFDKAMTVTSNMSGGAPTIEPGTQTITSEVTLYFEKN